MPKRSDFRGLLFRNTPLIITTSFATDSAPAEQQMPEVIGGKENGMEMNCNGHASTPESASSLEAPGTKQSREEQEDQLNANRPESSAENEDTMAEKKEPQTSNSSSNMQEPPASVSSDSVTVEIKEECKVPKKEDEMDTRDETKREDEDEDGPNGWLNQTASHTLN